MGPAQFEWLSSELDAAVAAKERVIVASHNALSPTAARPGMAAWNAPDVSARSKRARRSRSASRGTTIRAATAEPS